jgi:hypothetical protein
MSINPNRGIDKVKEFWNEHPLETIAIGALAVTATAKLIDALSAAQGRRAYARYSRMSRYPMAGKSL